MADEAFDKKADQEANKAKLAYELRKRQMGGEKAANDAKKASAEKAAEAKKATFIAEHTVVSGDTLSGLAQKYYQSQAREKWMAIYEANAETIGDNPSLIRVGQVLKIPKL